MYCDGCGTQLAAGQRFCGSCGKPVGMAAVPTSTGGRVSRHIQLVAILWLAASALHLIGGAVLFLLGNTLFVHFVHGDVFPFQNFLQGLMSTLGVWLFLKAIAGFAAGCGLLQREPWARTVTLVLGFLELLHVPFGTALGIYTIWVLLSPQAEQEYRQLARAA